MRPDDDDRPDSDSDPRITRRRALVGGAGVAGAAALAAYGLTSGKDAKGPTAASLGRADFVLRPGKSTVELGARKAETWTYGGALPGRELRLKQGERVRIRVDNGLPEPTSIHWHGIRLRNPADGVPGLTQKAIAPGASFLYDFTPPDAGTYFFHSHQGMQLDRGLHAALIIEPKREELSYDSEAVLVLDDWLDGVAGSPDKQLAQLKGRGMNMGAMAAPPPPGSPKGRHTTLDGRAPGPDHLAQLANLMEQKKLDVGDVTYPMFLINGRPPEDPVQVVARKGDRVRLRLINAAADTTFLFFVEGRPLTVTHTDGAPIEHVRTDALVLGMAERYDVLVELGAADSQRIVALPLGKPSRAVGVLRRKGTTTRALPADAPLAVPPRVASYSDMKDPARPPALTDVRETRLDLAFRMPYVWTIGGQAFPKADVIEAERGQAQRFVMRNTTTMPHPMHLHGHSFRPAGGGPLKDTILVLPKRETAVEWVADNPGTWAFHCHNAYHMESGMFRKVRVA